MHQSRVCEHNSSVKEAINAFICILCATLRQLLEQRFSFSFLFLNAFVPGERLFLFCLKVNVAPGGTHGVLQLK